MQKRPLVSHLAVGALACAGALCALSAQAQGSYFAVVPVSGASVIGQLRPVKMALAGAVPPPAYQGEAYEFNLGELLSLDGPIGTEPGKVQWSILSGSLPAGLALAGDRIVGTPIELAPTREIAIQVEYPSAQGTVGSQASYSFAVPGVAITEQGGYRAWADGAFAPSCEAYIRSADPQHPYVGATGDGVYRIAPAGTPMDVFCDQTTDAGGWILLMKQAANDGVTLQGDASYWKTGTVLHDTATGRNMADGNFISAAFARIPVARFRLQAANESTMRYQDNAGPVTGLIAFGDAKRRDFSDSGDVFVPSMPNWFVRADAYPNGSRITAARFGFNFAEIHSTEGNPTCAARWGWAANQDPIGYYATGTHDACGGLGGWGSSYGSSFMANNKGAWNPATLYLWGR